MSAPQSYARDKGRCDASPIFVPGEIYNFCINFDDPINDPGFGNFRLDLLDRFGALAQANIGTLSKHIVTADFYNIAITINFPSVANGYYHFRIYDTSAAAAKATSNMILVENSPDIYLRNTAYVSYRNKYNIEGFQYETNPNYYNKLRLPLIETDYQFESEVKQYRNVSDKRLRTYHKYSDEVVKIESYYFDKGMHRAAASMYRHDEIFIDNVFAVVKGPYQRENNLFSLHSKASIELILDQSKPAPPAAQVAQWFLINEINDKIVNDANDFIIVDN